MDTWKPADPAVPLQLTYRKASKPSLIFVVSARQLHGAPQTPDYSNYF